MTSRNEKWEAFADELGPIVEGDRDAIARHAAFLAEDDEARDLRHEASLVAEAAERAGQDYVAPLDLDARVLAAIDARVREKEAAQFVEAPTVDAASAAVTRAREGESGTSGSTAKGGEQRSEASDQRRTGVLLFFSGIAVVAVAAAAWMMVSAVGTHLTGSTTTASGTTTETAAPTGLVAHVTEIVRSGTGTGGLEAEGGDGRWAPIAIDGEIAVGGGVRTDERTRARVALSDGSVLVLNHGTEVRLEAGSDARTLRLLRGEIVADVAHLESGPRARVLVPQGSIEVLGTKFALSSTDDVTAVEVTRGHVQATNTRGTVDVHEGEEATLGRDRLPEVAPAVNLARTIAWSSLERPTQTTSEAEPTVPGMGSLRARRPGAQRDEERPLVLARHEVRVRIVGNVARTEIEEVFQNDSGHELEGIYRFPLPPDARIARLALDMNGELHEGAIVARNRAQRIWSGVIRNATTPITRRVQNEEFVWVPGPWRDPALLEWQRGGNFELRIFPIPAHGSRRVVIAYTETLQPEGQGRRYVYPLAHSADDSLRVGDFTFDVRLAGARDARSRGYVLETTGSDGEATNLRFHAQSFLPNGDLTIDFAETRPSSELTYYTYGGAAAVAPPDHARDPDHEVVELQRRIAADGRGYATFALRPELPARTEGRLHDYLLVLDVSQSMVGERLARARSLVEHMVSELDRRDRFAVLACDVDCQVFRGSDASSNGSQVGAPVNGIVPNGVPTNGGGAGRIGPATNTNPQGNQNGVMQPMVSARGPVIPSGQAATGELLRTPSAGESARLHDWLSSLEAAGASDLVAMLETASRSAHAEAGRETHVIYVGDGMPSTGHRDLGLVSTAISTMARRDHVFVSAVGIGGDADQAMLAAVARSGGGHAVPFVPGESVATTALAALETTYGVALREPSLTLPEGLVEIAPSRLGTLRAGEEVLVTARMERPTIQGDVVLRGTVGGQPFEQRYPVSMTTSTAEGNRFVPELWAARTIEELELAGPAAPEARIVALSKAYGVMSRATSLLVLESEAMQRAFGVDESQSQALAWTGEEEAEGASAEGDLAVGAGTSVETSVSGTIGRGSLGGGASSNEAPRARSSEGYAASDDSGGSTGDFAMREAPARRPSAAPRSEAAAPATTVPTMPAPAPSEPRSADSMSAGVSRAGPRLNGVGSGTGGLVARPQVASPGRWLRRYSVRVGQVSGNDGATSSETEAAYRAEQALATMPDSRDRHRNAVRALSRAGNVTRAIAVADQWIARDRLDPESLIARADLLAREGRGADAIRTLSGIVDLRPDDVSLQERLAQAYERANELAHSCAHRIALAELERTNAERVGSAVRCERSLGRGELADAVLAGVTAERTRRDVDRVLQANPTPTVARGEIEVRGTWRGSSDLDLALIAPDGTRISWFGGRRTARANDVRMPGREILALGSATVGSYQIEVERTNPLDRETISGEMRVEVLGELRTLSFTLPSGTASAIVGRATVRREQREEWVATTF